MSAKKEATQKSHPYKLVKRPQSTKITVDIEFKANQKGKIISLDWLPDEIQKLILAKLAAFEMDLEAIINLQNSEVYLGN